MFLVLSQIFSPAFPPTPPQQASEPQGFSCPSLHHCGHTFAIFDGTPAPSAFVHADCAFLSSTGYWADGNAVVWIRWDCERLMLFSQEWACKPQGLALRSLPYLPFASCTYALPSDATTIVTQQGALLEYGHPILSFPASRTTSCINLLINYPVC